jgi:two-component system, OmpR family, sensor histidine kinase MtrB
MEKRSGAPRFRPSIGFLSTLSTTLLVVFALGVTAALIWTSTRMHRVTETVIRDTRSMEIANEIELELLTYNRLSNVMAVADSPELATSRATLTGELRWLLVEAHAYVGNLHERELLDAISQQVDTYLAQRAELDARGLMLEEVIRLIHPSLQQAVMTLEELRELNNGEVRQANEEVLRLDRLAKRVGVGVGLLLLFGLGTVVLGVRLYLVHPVLALREAIRHFRGGEPGARAREEGPLELSEIAHALNEMFDALARQRQEQLTFVAGVAHDLRNPLSALKLGVQSLGREPAVATHESIRRTLVILDRQLGRVTRMVGDLLDASRIEAGELELNLEEVDLRKVAREVVELYAPTSPAHQVMLEAPEQPVRVRADPLRLEQVVSNLVSNAIKYSPAGGLVEVVVGVEGGEAVLAVSDRGVGIPPEGIPDLFMPFRRREVTRELAPGAGLGLSVVRRILMAHGGRIEVESVQGKGSTFRIRLPLGNGSG